jgi:acyl-CoA thioester hydrolase
MLPTFVHSRRVQFHETDAMGVVHHSNHIKIFEEARVEWLRDRGFMALHHPYGEFIFAVLKVSSEYYKQIKFDELLRVAVQHRLKGLRIHAQYAMYSDLQECLVASGAIELIPLTKGSKPSKLPAEMRLKLQLEPWDEIWPPKEGTSWIAT